MSPDSRWLLTGSSDWVGYGDSHNESYDGAELWNAVTGKRIRTFDKTGPVLSVALSPDGRRVLTGLCRKGVDPPAAILWDVATGNVIRKFEVQGDGITSVALSPDGGRVLTGSVRT